MTYLEASAALLTSLCVGFGLPTPFVAAFLLRHERLPTFFGMFPMYGGGFSERVSHPTFVITLALFAAVNAIDGFAGVLIWNGNELGAWLALGLLPLQVVFWIGFELPIPPILTLVCLFLPWAGWAALT